MKAISLFSGAGGLDLGFGRHFSIVGAFEKEAPTIEVYKKNFTTPVFECDLRKTSSQTLKELTGYKEVDIVIGGPPCQGISSQGDRNINDKRNSLLFQYALHAIAFNPKWFVTENVANLEQGEYKEKLLLPWIEFVRDRGYTVKWHILNAADYGVPQNRKRLIAIATRQGIHPPSFPKPQRKKISTWEAIGDIPPLLGQSEYPCWERSEYARSLDRENPPAIISGMTPVKHGAKTIQRFHQTLPGEKESISRAYRLEWGKPANTLLAGGDGNFTANLPIHPQYPRRICIREAARLHSFPDDFLFSSSRLWAGKQIGNSVPPKLAQAIASAIA